MNNSRNDSVLIDVLDSNDHDMSTSRYIDTTMGASRIITSDDMKLH